ncbi:hypothetical protein [Streptomyces sp. NBC_01443]|uniref:hypothetical protein n=1 Tax=Streptomyces sp. NBC_01443 TaxID=2903868 RepID=UPI00225831CA|nr:hypothetical protein [Streptomyces sp. NBC_01443]MCX4625724.1 hypothetical protein [Streptomyces sp. NBC_01443]
MEEIVMSAAASLSGATATDARGQAPDGAVALWRRVRTGPAVHEAELPVGDVAFAPDGHTLVTACWDDTVRLWETDPARLPPRLCAATAGPHDRELWQRHVPGTPYAPGCS